MTITTKDFATLVSDQVAAIQGATSKLARTLAAVRDQKEAAAA